MVLLWLRPSGCRMHVPGSMDISYMALRIPNGTFSGVDASLALVTVFLVATLSETDAELTAVRLRAEEQAPLPLQAGA